MRRTEIERLLPEVLRATVAPNTPLAAILDVMVQMHKPDERVLETLDAFFDPARTADAFVPLLARWVDLERLFTQSATRPDAAGGEAISTGTGRLRELIARAAFLSKWRGTRTGLVAFLETATGTDGFVIDEQVSDVQGRPRPFHMRISAPATQAPHRALIERIIELEKPAFVTYEIDFELPGAPQ